METTTDFAKQGASALKAGDVIVDIINDDTNHQHGTSTFTSDEDDNIPKVEQTAINSVTIDEGGNEAYVEAAIVDIDVDDNGLPIDRGWAWVILAAATMDMFIIVGVMKCFGIFFVEFQHRFNSSSSATSLIYTLQNAAYSIGAMLVMTLGQSMSSRISVVIGAMVLTVSYIVTGFATDITIVYFTGGLLIGLGNAFIQPHVITMISIYFKKYRALANSVSLTGVSLGGLVMAPLFTKLFEVYGFTGTFILTAGFNLNLAIIGVLLRPVDFYAGMHRNRKHKRPVKDTADKIACNGQINQTENTDESKSPLVQGDMHVRLRRTCLSENKSTEVTLLNKSIASIDTVFNSKLARFASVDILHGSMMDLTLPISKLQTTELKSEYPNKNKAKTVLMSIGNLFSRLFDFNLLTDPVFVYFLVCNVFLCAGNALSGAFVAPHGVDMGIDSDRVALLISTQCIVDLLSRVPFGYLTDKKWIKISTIVSVSSLALGIASLLVYTMTTFATIIVYSVITGLLQGVYFSLYVVLILDIFPLEKLKGAMGFTSLVQGLGVGASLPIAGYLRDYTGRYFASYAFIASLLMVGAVMCFFIPNIQKWSASKHEKVNNNIDKENCSL